MFNKIYKLSSDFKVRRKATPKTYLAFFLIIILYVFAYGMPSNSFKCGIIFLGLVVAFLASISEDDYFFVFYYFLILPFLLFRTIYIYPGLLLSCAVLLFLIFWILFTPSYFTMVVDYKLPEDITPAEASFLVSKDIGPQELISTLYSLFLRGYLEILDEGGRLMFHKKVDYENDPSLLSYEKFILDKVFFMPNIEIMQKTGVIYNQEYFPDKVDCELVLENLSNWADNFKNRLLDSLRFEKPVCKRYAFETKTAFLLATITYIVLDVISVKTLMNIGDGLAKIILVIEPIVVAILLFLLSFTHSLPLTTYGKEIYIKTLGFREFMKRVERPRLVWLLREGKIEIFNVIGYLYALNLINSLNWVIEILKEKDAGEGALLFSQLMKKVHLNWYKGKDLG
ncbi:MAG: DUF2207 domain-containing protein [bacterium]|nr:DUF2207 domain-containing protein [bacterium]